MGDVTGNHNSDKQSEHKTSNSTHSSNQNHSNSNKHNKSKDNVDNLTQGEKVALALNDPSVSDYVINANELKITLILQIITVVANKNIDTYQLETTEQLEGAPSDMKFYNAQPAKGSFATIIGVGSDKVFIAPRKVRYV